MESFVFSDECTSGYLVFPVPILQLKNYIKNMRDEHVIHQFGFIATEF